MGNIIIAGDFEDVYGTGDITERNENASYPSTNIVNFRSLSKHFRAQDATLDDWLVMINSGTISTNFKALDQGALLWQGMAATSGDNIYICVGAGSIWMQTAGVGDFADLSQTNRAWRGIVAAPNGNIYACVQAGDIYMQTAGAGNFSALTAGNKDWQGMAATAGNNIYCSVDGGSIWMQTAGAGAFADLVTGNKAWRGMCVSAAGNVYACVYGGSIWMQTAGAGAFADLSQTNRNWYAMCASPDGDVYASVYNGDIYKQTGGTGNFVALNQQIRYWRGLAASSDGNIYAAGASKDIYMQTRGIQAIVLDDVNFNQIEILGNDTDAWGAPAYDETFSISKDPRTGRYRIFAELTLFDYDYIRLYIPATAERIASPTVWKTSRLALLPNDPTKTITLSPNISYGYEYSTDIAVNDKDKMSGGKERSGRGSSLIWRGEIPIARRTPTDAAQLWQLNALDRSEPHVFYENEGDTQYAYICWRDDPVRLTRERNYIIQPAPIRFTEII